MLTSELASEFYFENPKNFSQKYRTDVRSNLTLLSEICPLIDNIQDEALSQVINRVKSVKRARNIQLALRSAFSYAHECGYIASNPLRNNDLVVQDDKFQPSQNANFNLYSDEEFDAALHNLREAGKVIELLMIQFLRHTGMKVSELLILKDSDLSYCDSVSMLKVTNVGFTSARYKNKANSVRVIQLTEDATDIIDQLIEYKTDKYGLDYKDTIEALFPHPLTHTYWLNSKQMRDQTQDFFPVYKDANQLRHAFVIDMLQAKNNPKDLAEYVGSTEYFSFRRAYLDFFSEDTEYLYPIKLHTNT